MNGAGKRAKQGRPRREAAAITDLLPYQTAMASWVLSDFFRKTYLAELGLGISDWRVLAMVGERERSTAAELVADTGLDHVVFHRAIKVLEGKQLITRVVDPSYRRSKILSLTGAGRTCHRRLMTKARELDATIAEWIGPAGFATTLAALKRINQEGRRL